MKQIWIIVFGLVLATLGLMLWIQRLFNPAPETIVASSLKSLQEQNRLNAFAARFVTVVTSRRGQFGLSAEKTLIMPAMVRYEVDLSKLTTNDVIRDACGYLRVSLPQPEVAGPEFDVTGIREYGSGAILMALTDTEKLLDEANRKKAKADVLSQASAEPMLKLARDATRKAIAANVGLPLKAAGSDLMVEVSFAGEKPTRFCAT